MSTLLTRGEGKGAREGDFKQWGVKCHKISLNKSYHFSYQFFQNCPCVKLMIFTTEISFCKKGAKLHFKWTPNFRAVLQPSAVSLAQNKNTSRVWRKPQLQSGLYMQWKYQKCQCWTGNCMHLQVWFFLHKFSASQTFISILYFYHQNTEANNLKHVIHHSSLKAVSLTPLNPILLLIYKRCLHAIAE